MVKFSVIIPAYNSSKTIERCIESCVNQEYKNIEIIVINDGSTDDTLKKIQKYKNIKIINKSNTGVSDSRNIGIKIATGEYFLLLDSDDYYQKDIFKELNKVVNENKQIEIIGFQLRKVDINDAQINIDHKEVSDVNIGENIVSVYIKEKNIFETSVGYAYKTEFYRKNKFQFAIGKNHEDFGLIPLILLKSKKMISTDFVGYNYVQTNSSITRGKNYLKTKKNVFDMFSHYDFLKSEVEKLDLLINNKKIFLSFLSNSLINNAIRLNDEDRKIYIEEIKKRNILNDLLSDTLYRKIKKIVIKLNLNLYYRIFG